ncbi:MAG: hypothetical protein Q4P07_09945 [Ornithinimicrobium sp.]|uniref:HAD family hydrolase n=1 Tax=Ornithinimicrobium sp. TaxID=1977084 RepID=UPI0026DEB631|nr:HAD family hydrolase [Ornithinimicrobium sp.]MDO5740457.1 hypothetical protein [Ornithinimicrobium sp.]
MDSPATARLSRLRTGTRVVVRYLIEDGRRATDALGELVARDDTTVTVLRRSGERVRIPLTEVVVAKEVPPAASRGWRIPPFLRRANVAVLDLDGVLRAFNATGWQESLERSLELAAGSLNDLAFSLPEVDAMVVGHATHAQWMEAFGTRLLQLGHAPDMVDSLLTTWLADHGTPLQPTVDLVDELLDRGTPVFVFTNGTDRVPVELETIGLGRLIPLLLNSYDLGWAKPAPEAYAVAHAEIERRLGRRVGTAEVYFTDDRPANVNAARAFGWQGRVFTPPPA